MISHAHDGCHTSQAVYILQLDTMLPSAALARQICPALHLSLHAWAAQAGQQALWSPDWAHVPRLECSHGAAVVASAPAAGVAKQRQTDKKAGVLPDAFAIVLETPCRLVRPHNCSFPIERFKVYAHSLSGMFGAGPASKYRYRADSVRCSMLH